jgi:molybdopterin converting factor small subunit
MTSGPGTSGTSSTKVEVTIRYWASARAAAGCDSETLTGHSVGDLLEKAATAHTGLGVILKASTILLDGRPVSASESLSAGVVLEVLPPVAGG